MLTIYKKCCKCNYNFSNSNIKKILNILILFWTIIITFFYIESKINFNSCFAQQNNSTNNLTTIEKGVLTIGTNATLKPFEFVDENGKITGFDVELIEKIANNLGLKPKIVDMPFESLILSVGSRVDCAIAAITKNEEREKAVSFSEPYYSTKQFVLTTKNKTINEKNDFKNLTLATQASTTANQIVEDLEKNFNQKKSKTYGEYTTMVNDLLYGRVDALILDRDTALIYEKLHENELKCIDGSKFGFDTEDYCIACSKQNISLTSALNEQINNLKNSPTYKKLIETHITAGISEAKNENEQNNSLKKQFETSFLKNNRWKLYLNGFLTTIEITIFAAIIGFLLGSILAVTRVVKIKGYFKLIKLFCKIYVDVIRGTPILLQLLILWFIVMKNSKNAVLVAIIALGLNSAAYVCEIIRGAINAIDRGQTEASLAMGFSPVQSLIYIVLPQGLKNSIPALCNEIISLLKETAITGYIAIVDLTRAADQVRASTYQALMPLLIAALIYFAMTKTANILLNLLEKRLGGTN